MRTARLFACAPLLTLAFVAGPLAREGAADEPAPAADAPAPAKRPDPAGLPPPVVRRPGGAPLPRALPTTTAPGAPGGVTPGGMAPGSTAPGSEAPGSIAPPPVMEFPSAPPQVPGTTVPAAPAAPAQGPAILEIVKNHNLPLADGTLALRLDVRFRADGPPGAAYRVWIHFHDNATGRPIQTPRPTFADGEGSLFVVTKPVPHAGGTLEYVAPLGIPYNAFPDPGPGRSIVVDATASLTLVQGESETAVHTSATNFRVHGADALPGTSPAAPAATTGFPPAR